MNEFDQITFWLILIFAAIIIIGIGIFQGKRPERWEYRFIDPKLNGLREFKDNREMFEYYGDLGFEYCGQIEGKYLFKRRLK